MYIHLSSERGNNIYWQEHNNSNTMGATSKAGMTYPSGEHPSSPPVFSGIRVAKYFVFCAVFCRSLFVLLAIVLSVLWFTASDYSFGIFKLFLAQIVTPDHQRVLMIRFHYNVKSFLWTSLLGFNFELMVVDVGKSNEWVSEWLFNANSAIFQLYHGEN